MPTYSHSRLESYQNCPRQFKLHYIDKIEVEEEEEFDPTTAMKVPVMPGLDVVALLLCEDKEDG